MPSQDDMDVDWDNDQIYLSRTPPSPTNNTPYMTPAASMSRPSMHRRDSSPGPSCSSTPFDSEQMDVIDQRDMLDANGNDPMSFLDPRRFTPTLHASLVSEILSLRRDLESKDKEIDGLEINLDHAKSESEEIQDTLSETAKENRSLKRQLQLVEGGSLSAVTELAKERDDALDTVSDIRKRLEQSQRKFRTQEEDTQNIQSQWEDERAKWDEERRNLERKVHVVEGRLKTVLNEVMAVQEVDTAQGTKASNADASSSMHETPKRSSSVLSRRRASITNSPQDIDFHSNRFSVMSLQNGQAPKQQGLSLADELAFDEEDEYDFADDEYYERSDSRATLSGDRPVSTNSLALGMKARRILGLSFDTIERTNTPETLQNIHKSQLEHNAKTIAQPEPPRAEYRDMGCQYTPPASPVLVSQQGKMTDASTMADLVAQKTGETVEEAYRTADMGTSTETAVMVSNSSQTTAELDVPTVAKEEVPEPSTEPKPAQTSSISTQTEAVPEKERPATPQAQLHIPKIAIHPPESSPPTPRTSVALPPHTKSISCQTDKELTSHVRSASVQTEEIRLDQRPIKLAAASLLPSPFQDGPTSDTEVPDSSPILSYFPPPPKSAKRRFRLPPVVEPKEPKDKVKLPETIDAYPGNNDNGPLAEKRSDIRRPPRSSSLFAGFEEELSDEEKHTPAAKDDVGDIFSDDGIMNRPTAKYTLQLGRLVSKPAPATILDDPVGEEQLSPKSGECAAPEPTVMLQRSAAGTKSNAKRPKPKEADIRRAAMISSSTAAHASRPRSPSAPNFGAAAGPSRQPQPPFPVPVRFSSRKVDTSASEGSKSPTPYGRDHSQVEANRENLRKVRSDVVARSKRARRQPSDYSTPTVSTSSAAPDSPQRPPMPYDNITAPLKNRSARQQRRHEPSQRGPTHRREESVPTSSQQTSVVDAIAQTMVGEWMWKYVRRRRSFGVVDNSREQWEPKSTEEVSANISGNGSRHKRWVWLAPYERAVMWSSKQPTSGHALLGKTGRKLVIQSVLDVKDDNPLPKGATTQNQFNRSILILTPQRALKFTALTVERHYVWLTALSFLSHSNMNINELATLPPAPQEEYTQRPPAPALRRNPIRDSIRVAKGKSRWNKPFAAQPPAVPEVPTEVENAGDGDPDDAAVPPTVPRFSSHARKRSNTAPRPNPLNNAFRSFSNHKAATTATASNHSTTTAGSSDLYSPTSIGGAPGVQSGQSSISYRTSEASGPSRGGQSNFFDAVGTVRMEAFVDRSEAPRYRGAGSQRTRHNGRRRQDLTNGSGNTYWPQSPETDFPMSEDGSDVLFRGDDPFRGF